MADVNKTNNSSEESLHEIENIPGVTNFVWIIENYESKLNILLESQPFHIEGDPDMEWCIALYRKDDGHCYSCGFQAIHLNIRNTKIGNNFLNPVKVKFSVGVSSKGKLYSRTMRLRRVNLGGIYGFAKFIQENELLRLLSPSGCLHVRLKITPLRNMIIGKTFKAIDNNFHPFLTNETFSDVVFHLDNSKFPAHKIVLSSASPVFSKMFTHEMIENISNVVHVQETDPNVFREMLRYIYTGKVVNLEIIAFPLFELANKYDLSGLRFICEQCLLNTLTDDNVINILELADSHDSVTLKKECIDYIDKHFDNVRTTEAFETVKRELLVELLCAVRAKKVRIRLSP